MVVVVALLLFDDVEVLDFAGPFEVFSVTTNTTNENLFRVITIAEKRVIRARNGLTIVVDKVIGEDIVLDNNKGKKSDNFEVDIFLVPGGQGTRREINNPSMVQFIQTMATERTKMKVLSVCTGSLLLAKASLLSGMTVTTHHNALPLLKQLVASDPSVTVVAPADYGFFIDNCQGSWLFAGGISCGIEMSFYVVSLLFGEAIANRTAEHMEYKRSNFTPMVKTNTLAKKPSKL